MSAPVKQLLPQRRNIYIVVVIILVLGTALGLYYLHYIPGNRQRLHQYGFRILGGISRNMTERNNDQVKLYTNILSGEYRNTAVNDVDDMKAALSALPERVKPGFIDGRVERNGQSAAPTATYIKNSNLEYHISPGNGIYARLKLPLDKLVKPIISYRNELFATYLVLKHDSVQGSIVYQHDSLGLDSRITPDSLLVHNSGATFSQITDADIQGVKYKLFCFPFTLGNERLVLAGLIKASDYRQRLGDIPVYLVYPLIIVLLLILISLPFLKIYLMGPYEQVRFSDLTGLGLAVFGGVTVITMIIIQVLLLARGYMTANQGLRDLSRHIEQAMQEEVGQMRRQLRFLDTTFRQVLSTGVAADAHTSPVIGVHGMGGNYRIPLFPATGKPYYGFERVNWVDKTGMQRWRLQLPDSPKVVLIDVKGRDYYNFFNDQYKNGPQGASVTLMDPVYSWSGGDFVINLVERSSIDSFLLLTFSAKMYALLNTVQPPGYGFCIIDNKGKVYIHSEADRNLKENFLDETDNAGPLKGAINSRQDTTLGNVHCYGKDQAVYIHPLSQRLVMHPVARRSFFLVTFYDNGYLAPVNLRILVFSLVFTFFTFLTGVCWLVANHGFSQRSFLYRDPLAARFTWIIPRQEDAHVYRKGQWFMLGYLTILLTLGVFGKVFDDYVTFALGLISPLNILILLYAYRLYNKLPEDAGRRLKTGLYLLLMLVYSGLVYWRLDLDNSRAGYAFWLFQGVLMLLMAGMWWSGNKKKKEHTLPLSALLLHYSGFVLLLALCLGVLPMMVFTWYAHNREIEQSVKKQQLTLAMTLEKRRPTLLSMVKNFRRTDPRVEGAYSQRCWRQGIYRPGNDSIVPVPAWDKAPWQGPNAPERFYSGIAGYIDMDYNDPLRYPVLNRAADEAWYWKPENKGLSLYYMPSPGNYPDSVRAIRITTDFPRRYLFLSSGEPVTMLIILVLIVLGGIFILIRSTVSRVFLLDFIRLFSDRAGCPEHIGYTDEQTRNMILEQQQKSALFRSKWNRLSGRQRIILLDLVTDGLANYRNVMEISAMIGEGEPLGICEGVIIVKDPVFRQFILEQRLTAETAGLRKQFQARSLWESMRTPLLVTVIGVGLFIFMTQEDVSKKLLVLLTTLSTLLPLLPKLLSNFRGAPVKGGE